MIMTAIYKVFTYSLVFSHTIPLNWVAIYLLKCYEIL